MSEISNGIPLIEIKYIKVKMRVKRMTYVEWDIVIKIGLG